QHASERKRQQHQSAAWGAGEPTTAPVNAKEETMSTIQSLWTRVLAWLGANKRGIGVLALVLVFTSPWPARGQLLDPCCSLLAAGLASIQAALSNVVGRGLNRILTIDNSINQYQQSVVWPANLIAQAQSLVAVLQGNLRQIQNLSRVPVGSATL